MSQTEGERSRERERDNSGTNGGLQRARADGTNGRATGRPLSQRTRNSSFAIPKMRSPSFMQREKEKEIPDANASPWGVEDDRTEAEKSETKALADKHIQSRVSKKMSGIGLPSSPSAASLSCTSPRPKDRGRNLAEDDQKDQRVPLTKSQSAASTKKGIRKNISRFGGQEEMQGIAEYAAAHSPGSTISSTSSMRDGSSRLGSSSLAEDSDMSIVTKSKSKVQLVVSDNIDTSGKAKPEGDLQKCKSKGVDRGKKSEKFLGRRGSKTHEKKDGDHSKLETKKSVAKPGQQSTSKKANEESDSGSTKRRGLHIGSKEKEYDESSADTSKGKCKEFGKSKSKKFGFSLSRKHRSSHQGQSRHPDDDAEDTTAEGGIMENSEVSGGFGAGQELTKELSIRQDDFVSYQTKPGKSKGRKSLGIFLQNNEG